MDDLKLKVLLLSSLIYCIHGCPVYLTISLTGKTIEDSYIEVNWGPDCRNKPEWIGVFFDDPSVSYARPEEVIRDLGNSSGKFVTNVKIGKLKFPGGWNRNDNNRGVQVITHPKGKCMHFYVASFNGNELLSIECLKIQPNWMGTQNHISMIPLKDLFIPGTHASGAYGHNVKTKSNLVKEYALSQSLDIWSQLVFGIRFLDFNIGYLDKSGTTDGEKYWIVNENMFVTQLQPILKDIRRFVLQSKEVVIIDFSAFPIGFYKMPDRHSGLLKLLTDELGDIALNRTQIENSKKCYHLSVQEILSLNKHVVIIYPPEELPYPESESLILCPTWKRFTMGNMNTSEALDFMRLLFTKKESSPVQDEGWIFHGVKGLEESFNTNRRLQTTKERAAMINPKISSWLGGPWSLTANVIALDFFTNTNIIDIAIYANLQKAFTIVNKDLMKLEIAH